MAPRDEELISEQIEYYRQRAPEYDETSTPPGDALAPYGRKLRAALETFGPAGRVLEIACGTGSWTEQLLGHAASVDALDASPEMIRRARRRTQHDPRVRFIEADVFGWTPEHQYDVVFFANWLSHVPPARFREFWDLVGRALAPAGRVFFVDESEDAWRHEELPPEPFLVDRSVPIVRRTLRDGRTYRVIKVFWNPARLERRLLGLGWRADVHAAGPFFWAQASTVRVR